MRFSSTPRGARLARHLAGHRLDAWGLPYDCGAHDTVTLIVGELCTNAVRHGRVPGRDFHLRLRLGAIAGARTVCAEVTDTRAERLPVPAALAAVSARPDDEAGAGPGPGRKSHPDLDPDPDPELADSGRGLLLVSGLAARWGWYPRTDGPGKTVWAEYALPGYGEEGVPAPRRG